jgi:hypothetical protein
LPSCSAKIPARPSSVGCGKRTVPSAELFIAAGCPGQTMRSALSAWTASWMMSVASSLFLPPATRPLRR